MENLKLLSQEAKRFSDFLKSVLEKAQAEQNKAYVLNSDEENLKKKIDYLNESVEALKQQKEELEKLLKADRAKVFAIAKDEAKKIIEDAERHLKSAQEKEFQAENYCRKYDAALRQMEIREMALLEREKKIKDFEQALRACTP